MLGAVILQYGNFEATKNLLESLERQDMPIIIVDNHTPKGFDAFLEGFACIRVEEQIEAIVYTMKGNIKILRMRKNGGYAYGNNHGVKELSKDLKVKYVWIMNNDIRVKEDGVRRMLEFIRKNPHRKAIGHTILNWESDVIQCLGGAKYSRLLGKGKNVFAGRRFSKEDQSCTEKSKIDSQINYLSGASFVMEIPVYQKLGGMNESLFLYYEEIDLFERAKSLGVFPYWNPDIVVEHMDGSTVLAQKNSFIKEYNVSRSSIIVTRLYFGKFLFPMIMLRTIYKTLIFLRKSEMELVKAMIAGTKDGILLPKRSLFTASANSKCEGAK